MTALEQQPSPDTECFLRIRKRYIPAFSGIALLIIIAQVLIQQHLPSQLSDSRVINVTGCQRASSQKLLKEALMLTEFEEGSRRQFQFFVIWKGQGPRTRGSG